MQNKYDAFYKVIRIIESCKTPKQLTMAYKVADNFKKTYNDKELDDEIVVTGWQVREQIVENIRISQLDDGTEHF